MNRTRINFRIPRSKKKTLEQACTPICNLEESHPGKLLRSSKPKQPKEKQTARFLSLLTHLDNVKKYNDRVTPDNDAILALDSLPHTKSHESHLNAVLDDYVNCLSCYKEDKWTELLRPVKFDGPSFTTAPYILVEIGGLKTPIKTQLANLSLIDWMAASQKKVVKAPKTKGKKLKLGGIPYYQPSSQNQRLRTFFGTVSRVFTWQYDLCDFNFNSGLTGFIKDLYAKREREFGKVITIFFLFRIFLLTTLSLIFFFSIYCF